MSRMREIHTDSDVGCGGLGTKAGLTSKAGLPTTNGKRLMRSHETVGITRRRRRGTMIPAADAADARSSRPAVCPGRTLRDHLARRSWGPVSTTSP
jgi:hypothetical protein